MISSAIYGAKIKSSAKSGKIKLYINELSVQWL
jgi:hypothetical protein